MDGTICFRKCGWREGKVEKVMREREIEREKEREEHVYIRSLLSGCVGVV